MLLKSLGIPRAVKQERTAVYQLLNHVVLTDVSRVVTGNKVCLVDQDFVKDPSVTVAKHLENVAKAAGGSARIVRFERFVMGEGLEKKNENFAEEIAKIANR